MSGFSRTESHDSLRGIAFANVEAGLSGLSQVEGIPALAVLNSASVLHSSSWECMSMTNFVVYLIGTILVVAGLAYGASRLGVSQVWIIAGALVIIGFGLMGGIVKTRQKDPAS